jgi:hypothetical protein
MSTIGYHFASSEQRASMNPAVESGSSGNSRAMKRTLPVSTYLVLNAGQVLMWKFMQ